MLDQMRKGSKNVFIYFFFGILIIVFTFYFGPGADGCTPSERRVVASTVGVDIYNADLDQMTNRVARRQQGTGDADFQKLQKKSAEALSLVYLLSEEAEKKGFVATDDELRDFIMDEDRNLDFQIYSQEGKFDPEIYQNFVENGLLLSIEDYQEFKRKELVVRKYMTVLENSVVVSDTEVDALNAARNTKVELEFVAFDPKTLQDVIEFPQSEIDDYLAKSGEAVKKYYDDNKKEFGDPKRVRVRRIMVKKAPEAAPDGDKKEANQKWDKVKDKVLTKNEDFAEVAKSDSEDIVYGSKGGDMGFSELGDMNVKMANVIDSMKQGEVKEYESDIARFLLKLEEIKEAKYTPYDEVKGDIAKKLLLEGKGKDKLGKLAEQLLAEAKKDPKKSLEDAVAALKPAAPAEPPADPVDPDQPADPTDPADPADPTDPADPADPEEPAKVTPRLTAWDIVKATTTGKFAREPRRSFKFDQEKGTIVPTSLPWTDVPRIGDNIELARAAFELTADKPLVDKVVAQDDKFYVVRLKERSEPTKEELDKGRTTIREELRRKMLAESLGSWQVIFFRPDLELEEVSPYLARVLAQAKENGRIRMDPDAFPALTESKDGTDADAGTEADGGDKAAEGDEKPADKK